jgi:hypothetical protein
MWNIGRSTLLEVLKTKLSSSLNKVCTIHGLSCSKAGRFNKTWSLSEEQFRTGRYELFFCSNIPIEEKAGMQPVNIYLGLGTVRRIDWVQYK